MTLLDLTKELLTYLVRFREQAAGDRPTDPERLESELEAIFARMEDQAAANPLLAAGYAEVRYSLAALVDEVALTCHWPHQAQWGQRGWERRLYGSQDGPRRFFDFLDRLDTLPKDVLAVHYLCLALGFCGCYQPGDPELQRIKIRTLGRLPGLEPAPAKPPEPTPAAFPAEPAARPRPIPPPSLPILMEPIPSPTPPPASPAARRPLRDLRYLLAGGLAVLAFACTLVLGVVVFFDKQADLGPPRGHFLDALLKPRLPSPPETATQPAVGDLASATVASASTSTVPTTTSATTTTAPTTTSATITSATTTSATTTTAPTTTTSSTTTSVTTTSATTTTQAQPPAAPPVAPAPTAAPTTYLLHAGLFVGPVQSGRLAERLTQAGFPAWVKQETRADGQVRYRVYAGPYPDPDRAQAALEAIVARFKFSPFIVDNPTP